MPHCSELLTGVVPYTDLRTEAQVYVFFFSPLINITFDLVL